MSNGINGSFYIVSKENGYYLAMDGDDLYFREEPEEPAEPEKDPNFQWSYIMADDALGAKYGAIANLGQSKVITLRGAQDEVGLRLVLQPLNSHKQARQRLELVKCASTGDEPLYTLKLQANGFYLTKDNNNYVIQHPLISGEEAIWQQVCFKPLNG